MGSGRALVVAIVLGLVVAIGIPVAVIALAFSSLWAPHYEKLYSEGTPSCAVVSDSGAVFVAVPIKGPGYNFVDSVSPHGESGGGALAFGWLASGSGFSAADVRPTSSELEKAVHGSGHGGWKASAGTFLVKIPVAQRPVHVSLDGINMVSSDGETLADQDVYFHVRADGEQCTASKPMGINGVSG